MKVEIISIGDALLSSDILDTNAAYISRTLRELNAEIIYKVTVGEDLARITDTLRIALNRADAVFAVGGRGRPPENLLWRAAASATQRPTNRQTGLLYGSVPLARPGEEPDGFLLDDLPGLLICLPGNRREMAYLLETKVFPTLRARADLQSEWLILRVVGVMESSLRQQLSDLTLPANQRLSFDSYAGQTSIRLRVQAATAVDRQTQLAQLQRAIRDRLGDQIFGAGEDRLERVILEMLAHGGYRLAIVECCTGHFLSQTLGQTAVAQFAVTLHPATTEAEINASLGLQSPDSEERRTQWQRQVVEALRRETAVSLALFLYKETTPGGARLSVFLASEQGVSITQRSFSGQPQNIEQWASDLALAHLHRWLLAHGGVDS